MARIQWARAAQFNWTFDNMGGTPLMEAVHGNWSGVTGQTAVAADGKVYIQSPMPGGGVVYYLRGVWQTDAVFPWNGFWAEPESGTLTNYYEGGSFQNQGTQTVITLGTGLAAGTEVQVYYIYLTGEKGIKYEALNSYPCIRPAYRQRDDYTFDFAVDRMLDLMAILHFAGRERGRDYTKMIELLWEAFYPRETSRTSPLVLDTFERGRWDKGSYLLYYDSSLGLGGFEKFAIELYPGDDDSAETSEPAAAAGPRALRVILNDYTDSGFAAWWGYGLNWSLAESPFSDIDQVRFKLRSRAASSQVRGITKTKWPAGGGSGSATLIVTDNYSGSEKYEYQLQITSGGEIGTAEFTWWRYNYQYELEETQTGIKTAGSDSPLSLGNGLMIYWEPGTGNDFELHDFWHIWVGDPKHQPRRLQVILNDSEPGDADPWGPEHTFIHAVPDRFEALTEFEVDFDQFWRIDNVVDDGDRRREQWGQWWYLESGHNLMTVSDRQETEIIEGEIFYTQRRLKWETTGNIYSFGFWVGVNTAAVDSSGRTNVNFLINPSIANTSTQTIRVKVQDANGEYFYKDEEVIIGSWQRLTINFAAMTPEVGTPTLTHPISLIDIGIDETGVYVPEAGTFLVTDIKFDDHVTFAGAERLRLLEFKYEELPIILSQSPAWWLDEVGVNLEAGDDYPYAPRLAISLSPYGLNAWRGPTLVHYAHPLGPYLVDRHDLKTNYLRLHRDAQDEFNERYGGVKGPILPVHTRNDIENIALCGEENFGEFCWWPRYRDYYKLVAGYRLNGDLTDETGNHNLTWTPGDPTFTVGICQPGNTALVFDGSGGQAYCASHADFQFGSGDFTIEVIAQLDDVDADNPLVTFWTQTSNQRSWLLQTCSKNLRFHWSPDGTGIVSITGSGDPITSTTEYYHLVATRSGDALYFYVNGASAGSGSMSGADIYAAHSALRFGRTEGAWPGYLDGAIDFVRIDKGLAMSQSEVEGRRQIIQGQLNGSAYPEVGHGLGQYWAFYRLAEYYFTSNDPAAWEILENWINWFNEFIDT